MEVRFKLIGMCDRILYRKKGDLFECIRVSPDGEEECLGTSTREDILDWLATHGLGFVRRDVLASNLEMLCEENIGETVCR